MPSKISFWQPFSVRSGRRGFTIFLMFMVLMLVLFSDLFSQSREINAIGKLQTRILNKYGEIRPRVDARVKLILPEENR